jgi:hypothetical protein
MSLKGDMVKAQMQNMLYLWKNWDAIEDNKKKEIIGRMYNAFRSYSWNI